MIETLIRRAYRFRWLVLAAAAAVGDAGFYVSLVERVVDPARDKPQDWWVAAGDFEGYDTAVAHALENVGG